LGIEKLLSLIANYGFPIVLSIYLLWRLDYFFSQIVENQKEFSRNVTLEIIQIKQDLRDLRLEVSQKR